MATFKHISSKNADYGAAEQYLTFEHDEFTMKPTHDENGRLIPRDAQDNGLTVDRAQVLGEQFCKEHFPGHQAIVCTHPDGHNHSGNIHVHIVINSLRIAEVPLLPYMERPADTSADYLLGIEHKQEIDLSGLSQEENAAKGLFVLLPHSFLNVFSQKPAFTAS